MGIERRDQYTRASEEGQTLVPLEPVRLGDRPRAGVAKLADARDSKSRGLQGPCGFDPHLRHHRSHQLSSNMQWASPAHWQVVSVTEMGPGAFIIRSASS